MDEPINTGTVPVTATTPPVELTENTGKPKKKSSLKILIIILAFLIFVALAYYLIFTLNLFEKIGLDTSKTTTEEQNTQQDVEEDIITLSPFKGEFISTQLPDGWSIKEYKDGEGTNMLTSGVTYTGLTGLKIFKGTTEEFYMQAVSGLGFAGCPYYAKFEDESTTYYDKILEDNQVSGQEVTVTDYTNTKYEEFTWLGVPFRRIAKVYVYDTVLGNSYFESPCVPSLISFDEITLYTLDQNMGSSTYDYGATEDATLEDLLIVDQILNDMELTDL